MGLEKAKSECFGKVNLINFELKKEKVGRNCKSEWFFVKMRGCWKKINSFEYRKGRVGAISSG